MDRLVKIGGVPEHFNLPWKFLVDEGDSGVEFVDVREGSGAMVKGLLSGRFDGIVALTECVVAESENPESNGSGKMEIIGTFVESKLVWGVHVAGKSELTSVDDLRGKRFGISRRGSGSHVMAAVMAEEKGWTEGLDFVVIGGFQELRDAVNSGQCDVFIWEKFMTKPYDATGEVTTIGEIPTPWPCFVLAVRKEEEKSDQITRALISALKHAIPFKANEGGQSIEQIINRFSLASSDAKEWLDAVEYSDCTAPSVSIPALEKAFSSLQKAKVLPPNAHLDLDRLLSVKTLRRR